MSQFLDHLRVHFRTLNTLDYLYLLSARLQIQSFHFFICSPHIDDASLARLYILTCSMVETAVQLDYAEDLTGSITAYIQCMLVLAALVILRISRCHLRQTLDLGRGKKAYFDNILLHRKMTIQEGDLPSRTTVILMQLWTSKNAFRRPDSSIDSLTLLCRSRLSVSVVFDCFWRWRREFAGQATPYEEGQISEGISNTSFRGSVFLIYQGQVKRQRTE